MSIPAISLFLIVFSVFLIIWGICKIHMLPGNIATKRGHPQAKAIEICSLLGLLIFPFWMFALLWAYGGVIGVPLPEPPQASQPEVVQSEVVQSEVVQSEPVQSEPVQDSEGSA